MRLTTCLVLALATLASCGQEKGRAKMERPIVRDVAIPPGAVDLHDWSAWSVSPDGGTIAVARGFGWPGGVMIDVASGTIENQGDARLVEADHPLWWQPTERVLRDPGARMSFAVPPDESANDTAALRNDGAGVLARLVRSGDKLRLQVWNREAAVTWTTEIDPVPDTAGIALSPSGDTVALAQSTQVRSEDLQAERRRPISVQLYDVRDGALRWSTESALLGDSISPLRQPVGFSADGAALWIAGRSATSEERFVEERSSRDATAGRIIWVDHGGIDDTDTVCLSRTHLWIAGIVYSEASHLRPSTLWHASYALYAIGTRMPVFDTDSLPPYRDGAIDRRSVFDEGPRGAQEDSRVRAMRPLTDGGVVLVQGHGDSLRVTTWKTPPGASGAK